MTFNSLAFVIFYPTLLLLYFLFPKRARLPLLLIASYFFYMYYQPSLIVLILATTGISWLAALGIEKSKNTALRRALLAITLIACLGVLFFYKYFDFLMGSVVGLIRFFGGNASPIVLSLVLPVGISFYTFQTLSYVIDVYRGRIAHEKNFFYYALFVSFFPQLVAGPIERPENLLPQLKEKHTFTKENALQGAKHMLVGYFKKICVADLIAETVNLVYNAPEDAAPLGILIATALFAVQIYCDFSGYTDIAIGVSRIMGIRLMQNFNHPYRARTIKEFWGRWHISLSSWFKDYLYIPLGGSRCKKWRHMLNLMIVFAVSGLWHGASFTFVVWGILHGAYQVIGNLTKAPRAALRRRLGIAEDGLPLRIVQTAVTSLLVGFAWLFFRANSIADAGILLAKFFSPAAWQAPFSLSENLGLSAVSILTVLISLALLYILDHLVVYGEERDGASLLMENGAFVYVVWTILMVYMLLLATDKVSTFIYFQF
jgi:D-alanyl-lipoteichoic acid acyltransferase DltB (MBOAT superfamily)